MCRSILGKPLNNSFMNVKKTKSKTVETTPFHIAKKNIGILLYYSKVMCHLTVFYYPKRLVQLSLCIFA